MVRLVFMGSVFSWLVVADAFASFLGSVGWCSLARDLSSESTNGDDVP